MTNKEIYKILQLIGKAHDLLLEAQDLMSDYYYFDEDDTGDYQEELKEIVDSLESELSQNDFMGELNPVETFKYLVEFGRGEF